VRSIVVFQGDRGQRFEEGVEVLPYRHFLLETLPALEP
jgi:hypothetical protein